MMRLSYIDYKHSQTNLNVRRISMLKGTEFDGTHWSGYTTEGRISLSSRRDAGTGVDVGQSRAVNDDD